MTELGSDAYGGRDGHAKAIALSLHKELATVATECIDDYLIKHQEGLGTSVNFTSKEYKGQHARQMSIQELCVEVEQAQDNFVALCEHGRLVDNTGQASVPTNDYNGPVVRGVLRHKHNNMMKHLNELLHEPNTVENGLLVEVHLAQKYLARALRKFGKFLEIKDKQDRILQYEQWAWPKGRRIIAQRLKQPEAVNTAARPYNSALTPPLDVGKGFTTKNYKAAVAGQQPGKPPLPPRPGKAAARRV